MSVSPASREGARCPIRDDYHPFSPEVTADPVAALTAVASEDPVFFNTHSGWWSVAGYRELRQVLRDTKRFSSSAAILHAIPTPRSAELAPRGAADACPALINSDPPVHRRIRKLANQAFTRSVIASWVPIVEQWAGDLIDGFVDQGQCEFIDAFAMPLPISVISQILGVPADEQERFFKWSWALLALRIPSLTEAELDEAWRWNGDWAEYLEDMIVERRRQPRADLVSALIQASETDEAKLDNNELRSVVSQLLIAGNETTRHLLTTLALRLAEQPELVERVVADQDFTIKVIEEELRHRGPVRGLFRVATEDVTLGGAQIQAGDLLQLCFSAANHDDRMFDRPFEFELDRPNITEHLAFGRGEHFCIGAPLARMEAQVALPQIAARLRNLRRADDGPLRWQPNVIVTGLDRLDLCWDPAGNV